jgi:tight adherence protein C
MPLYLVGRLFFAGTVSLAAFLFYLLVPKKSDLEQRLEGLMPRQEQASLLEKPLTSWQKFLGRLGANVPVRVQEYGKYRRMLIAAGIKKERFPVFMGSKILLTVVLPGAYLLSYGLPVEEDNMTKLLASAILAILGFLLPSFWLSMRVRKRQMQIFFDLPDVLDLMTVCVEAGQSIDASMITICDDPNLKRSPLISEMKIVLQETRAGKPRLDALRDMGERAMMDDLKAFAAMLIQTERLGTSLAQALRVHSDSFRTIRMQRAQEAAAKTAVKLLFPLIFFIFPALFVVMLMPALIRVARVMSSL